MPIALFRERFGEDAPLPDYFVNAQTLSPDDHLAVQAAAQKHIDSSISKTINVPREISFEAFKDVYLKAYEMRLQGLHDLSAQRGDRGGARNARRRPEPPRLAADTDAAESAVRVAAQPRRRRLHDAAARPAGSAARARPTRSNGSIPITPSTSPSTTSRRTGAGGPFEIFINSKNMEAYAWTLALTRMISAVFRRGGDVSFVVDELKAVFDPRGGQWMGGHYVPSLLAAIGDVIERHLVATGFMAPRETAVRARSPRRRHRGGGRARALLPALRLAELCAARRLRHLRLLRLFALRLISPAAPLAYALFQPVLSLCPVCAVRLPCHRRWWLYWWSRRRRLDQEVSTR